MRHIAEQVSSVSPQASLRRLGTNAGTGRAWLVVAEPDAVGYLPDGLLSAQNDPLRSVVLTDSRRSFASKHLCSHHLAACNAYPFAS